MYVQRNQSGGINGCYRQLQPGIAEEWLADDHPDVVAVLNPAPLDLSNMDNLDRMLKALGLLMRDYCNELKAGTYAGSGAGGTKTIAEVKADFSAKYNSLP